MSKILFVEDEPWGVNTYFGRLKKAGFQCELAQDFDQARKKLQHESFDILSLDIMFSPGKKSVGKIEPRSAGLRLLELIRAGEIKNCDPKMAIIVLTAVQNKLVEDKIKNLGVYAYLKKPVSFDRVIDTIMNLKKSKEVNSKESS